MQNAIEEAKAGFTRAKERIAKCLNATPEDKLYWSPSPTSRSPIKLVAHSAMGTQGIGGILAGKPFPFASMAEMDATFRAEEETVKTKEQALALLEKTSDAYLKWLDTVTPEQIASTVQFPMGAMPMAVAITFAAEHMRSHAAQLDYLQTIIGDLDWHM